MNQNQISIVVIDSNKFRISSIKSFLKGKNIQVFDMNSVSDNIFIINDVNPSFVLIDFKTFNEKNESFDVLKEINSKTKIYFLKEPSDNFTQEFKVISYPLTLKVLEEIIYQLQDN